MLHLRMFGGLSVEADGSLASGAAAQRKTLALLALVAAAGRRGVSRDKLIAYLWPEADTEHGRGLLKQACYALRRDLRAPDLFLGTTELRLNPDVISSDLQLFEDSLERGDTEAAAGAYGGAFLDGFFLSEASEFEQWVEDERARLAKRACAAVESLATRAASDGNVRTAVQWWRRLTELDPLGAQAALGLMRALDDAGERAEAIEHGHRYEAFVRRELDAEPAGEVLMLIERLHHQTPVAPQAVREVPIGQIGMPAVAMVPSPSLRRPRRATTLSIAAVVTVAVLMVGAAAYTLRARHVATGGGGPLAGRKMLAVLPLENRSSPADEYFTDGLSEAIATRLGSIRSLGVIAWQSTRQYKGTHKSPQEIGRELGAQYLLEGTVRWDKPPRGPSQVRVSPMLIRVADGTQLWAEQYDTVLSGVFALQSDLATRVAGALNIALEDAERRLLEARPTANLEAYDAYLRGREAMDRDWDPADVQTALHMFERAVALDSSFALAVAWLAITDVRMYWNYVDRDPRRLTRAKSGLDRSLRLAADLPDTHEALGFYAYEAIRDYDQAVREFLLAKRSRPSDANLTSMIGSVYERQGRWNEAVAYGHEAALLDPRNGDFASTMGDRYMALREYAAANYHYGRALALSPRSVSARLTKALGYVNLTGDRRAAQRLLPDVSENMAPTGLQNVVITLCDIVLLLSDEQQTRLIGLTPAALDGDTAALALAKAFVYRRRDQVARARLAFDSARVVLEHAVRHLADDRLYHALLGLALAGLGRNVDAVREGQLAVALLPVSVDALDGALLPANLARIYVLLGEREKAIDELQVVLSRPGPLSPNWLRVDPFWDPLRANPRFQRLVVSRG